MTTLRNTRTILATAVLTAALFILCGSELLANNGGQNNTSKESTDILIPEKFVHNLAAGIQSDNDGLKRSSIYYAAYYDIEELSEVLVKELAGEKNPETRVFIALALYKIGNKESIEALDNLMLYNGNIKAQTFSDAVLNLLNAGSTKTVSAQK